jgi:hypothetical protein
MESFIGWLIRRAGEAPLEESNTRYSVEINFRTKIKEVLEHYAKICLGYVSAALKHADYHVKQVFDDNVIRLLVSSRNWDDGEHVVVVSWNPHHQAFFITKGNYNKMHKNVTFPKGSSEKCDTDSANEIAQKVKNLMHHLKDVPDKHLEKLKKVPLKTGPKKRV